MDCCGSNVANKDCLRDRWRETRTDNQNFAVCKKQLSSWNCFYVVWDSANTDNSGIFEPKWKHTARKTTSLHPEDPTDNHKTTLRRC